MKKSQRIVTWLLALVLICNTLALGKIEVQAEEPVTQEEESVAQARQTGYQQLIGIDLGESGQETEVVQEVPEYNRYQATKWDTYSSSYFPDQLSGAQRQLYNDIYNTCMAYLITTADAVGYNSQTGFTGNIAVPTGLTESDLKEVISLIVTNNPQFYFINEYYGYTSDYSVVRIGMYPEWVSGATRATVTNEVSAKIEAWLAIIQQEGTPLAQEKKAHDLVVGNTEYETGKYNQSCAGVFLEGKAVCAGYAEAFELLCNGVGINTIAVTSEVHEWNLVQMYGRWYNVDCTWDDQGGTIYYNYFNVSDADVNEGAHVTESVWSGLQVPTCSTSSWVNISGIYCIENADGIRAGAVHEKNDSNTTFRWLVYDVNQGTWTVISDWQSSEWVTWKPKKGNYWLRVEAKTSDGNTSDYTIAYNPTKSYTGQYVDISGIYCIEGNDGIRAGAVHEKNDANTKFRWMVYDVNQGTWTVISDWQNSEWVTWKPKKGNYWLRVEAKTSGGDESNYTIAYNPSKNYADNYVEIKGIYCVESSDGIRAGAVHEKNDSNTKFRWLVYDVNQGTWTVISNWQKSEWVTWEPNKGNYWLRVEAKTSAGDTSDCTIAYNVNK